MKKKATKSVPAGEPAKRSHEEEIRYRAKRWAELHSDPKTRDKMDTQLEGLSKADQRKVYLNGQRIASGMPFKILLDEFVEAKGKMEREKEMYKADSGGSVEAKIEKARRKIVKIKRNGKKDDEVPF